MHEPLLSATSCCSDSRTPAFSDIISPDPAQDNQNNQRENAHTPAAEQPTPCGIPASPPRGLNITHQRRRVNPESLALKLGPDLVRDLDALIPPGNTEMPSFAVRKELQERYNIDRRHIYDYFHSKGLRVVKEDKHGNAVVPKDMVGSPSLPNLRPLRQAPPKDPILMRRHPAHLLSNTTRNGTPLKPRGITKSKPGRPRKNVPKQRVPSTETIFSRNDLGQSNQSSYTISPFLPPSIHPCLSAVEVQEISSLQSAESLSENKIYPVPAETSCDILHTYQLDSRPVFENVNEIQGPGPSSAPSAAPFEFGKDPAYKIYAFPSPDHRPLVQREREAFYRFLSDILGPVHGIQESVCTYKSYMEQQSRIYYARLLSSPYGSSRSHRVESSQGRHVQASRENEFRSWIFSGFDDTGNLNNSTSRHSAAAKSVNPGDTGKNRKMRDFNPLRIDSLDDLFPALSDSGICLMDDVSGSPVVRSSQEADHYVSSTNPSKLFCDDKNGTEESRAHHSAVVDVDMEDMETCTRKVTTPPCTPKRQVRGSFIFSCAPLVPLSSASRQGAEDPKWSTLPLPLCPVLPDAVNLSISDNDATTEVSHDTASEMIYANRKARSRMPSQTQIKGLDIKLERHSRLRCSAQSARIRTSSAGGGI